MGHAVQSWGRWRLRQGQRRSFVLAASYTAPPTPWGKTAGGVGAFFQDTSSEQERAPTCGGFGCSSTTLADDDDDDEEALATMRAWVLKLHGDKRHVGRGGEVGRGGARSNPGFYHKTPSAVIM